MKYLTLRDCYVGEMFRKKGEVYDLPDDMVKSPKSFKLVEEEVVEPEVVEQIVPVVSGTAEEQVMPVFEKTVEAQREDARLAAKVEEAVAVTPAPAIAEKPREPNVGEYMCGKCHSIHQVASKVGKSHLKHKQEV